MFRNAGHQHGINILIPKNRIASRFRGHPGHHQYVLEWMVEPVANDLGRHRPESGMSICVPRVHLEDISDDNMGEDGSS